jgi:hypothetical protein
VVPKQRRLPGPRAHGARAGRASARRRRHYDTCAALADDVRARRVVQVVQGPTAAGCSKGAVERRPRGWLLLSGLAPVAPHSLRGAQPYMQSAGRGRARDQAEPGELGSGWAGAGPAQAWRASTGCARTGPRVKTALFSLTRCWAKGRSTAELARPALGPPCLYREKCSAAGAKH